MHFSSKNAFFTILVTISFFTKFLEDLHLRRDFCQTVNSTEHLSVAIAVFCVPCELQTPNLAVFFQIFIYLHPTIKINLPFAN